MQIICGEMSIPVVRRNIHYFSWSNGRFARETIAKNCPSLSNNDIDSYFKQADLDDCVTLYPKCNITILSDTACYEEDVYRVFNKALMIQRDIVQAEYCIFDMRSYLYRIPRSEKNNAYFPYEYSNDGGNNSEYVWMIRTRGFTNSKNIVWLRSAEHNNSYCTSKEIPLSQAPFECFSDEIDISSLSKLSLETLTDSGNAIYSEFVRYYHTRFATDISAMISPLMSSFFGFYRDYLINVDTFHLRNCLIERSISLPEPRNMAFFAVALWTIVVSDLIVFNKHLNKSKKWALATQYPKFTQWNYYAQSPRFILKMFIDCFPEYPLQKQIQELIDSAGEFIVRDMIADMCSMLHFSSSDADTATFFAKSWLTLSDEGEPYADNCFIM